MKLDDLKEMNIPRLAPIGVEYNLNCFPPEVRKCLGYFRSIKEEVEEGYPVELTYYGSFPNSSDQVERDSYFPINEIRSVTMLAPKQK